MGENFSSHRKKRNFFMKGVFILQYLNDIFKKEKSPI